MLPIGAVLVLTPGSLSPVPKVALRRSGTGETLGMYPRTPNDLIFGMPGRVPSADDTSDDKRKAEIVSALAVTVTECPPV
jgi:hypothetical protein